MPKKDQLPECESWSFYSAYYFCFCENNGVEINQDCNSKKKLIQGKEFLPSDIWIRTSVFLCLVLLSQGIIFLLISFKFHRF